mgnify:CR=1 FL=1
MSSPSFGIQSWCFRNFKTIPEFTARLKETGVKATELCGVQADFNKPELFDDVIAQFKQADVKILSIGVQLLAGKPEERNYFEFCKKAGVKYMSVNFQPAGMWDAFKQAEKLAEEYDIQLGIHNHGGAHWLGNTAILEHIFKNTGKRIGLTLDTAWAIDARQDPIKMVETFGDRLVGIHVKDFTFTSDRMFHDVVVGTGNLKLPAFVDAVNKVGFKGFTVIEYEGDVENPVPALTDCVKILNGLIK